MTKWGNIMVLNVILKTKHTCELCELFRREPKIKEGQGHISYSQDAKTPWWMLSRLLWKDPQVLRAVDSHRAQGSSSAQGTQKPQKLACSAAVSLMRFQVQSLSLIWPAYWHQAKAMFFFFFLTKSFQTPGPEARLSVGHKGLRPRTSAGLSKILPPPMCLPSKSRLPSFFLWGHCRASIHYVFSIEHIKTFQVHEMFLTACISNSLAGLSKSFLIQSLPFASLFCCSLKHTPSSGILNYVVFLRHVLIYMGLLDFEHRRLLQWMPFLLTIENSQTSFKIQLNCHLSQ